MNDLIGYLQGLAFCCIRPGVALMLIPFAGNESLGIVLRVPLMLMIALLPQQAGWPASPLTAFGVEALIGLTLGLLLSVTFHVVSAAGAMLDMQRGYTAAVEYDPNFREEVSLLQTLFVWCATLTFFTGPGLRAVYGFFADAWALWPPGAPRPDTPRVMQELAAQRLALAFAEGARLAMPLIGLMLLVDIALGLMSRYVRRLNPFMTAPAVKGIVLSFAIVFCIPIIFARINALFLTNTLLK